MRNCWTNVKNNKTQNNLFEHKTDGLAFKLLMLIIVKQLFIFNFKLTFVLLYPSQLYTSNWNKTQKENIYVWMQNNWFETKMWCYKLMFGKRVQPCPVTYKN